MRVSSSRMWRKNMNWEDLSCVFFMLSIVKEDISMTDKFLVLWFSDWTLQQTVWAQITTLIFPSWVTVTRFSHLFVPPILLLRWRYNHAHLIGWLLRTNELIYMTCLTWGKCCTNVFCFYTWGKLTIHYKRLSYSSIVRGYFHADFEVYSLVCVGIPYFSAISSLLNL